MAQFSAGKTREVEVERPAETPPMDIVDSDTAEDAVVGLDSE